MQSLRVLNFHGIGTPDRRLEPGEEAYWISAEMFCAILDRVADHPDRYRLRLTFDDGNLSDHAVALPQLVRRDLQASFFIPTARIGQQGSLNEKCIRELLRAGMHIGSHGINHVDWSAMSGGDLDSEIHTSKALLEDLCSLEISAAAIPFGRYNARVLRALKHAGYKEAYSSAGGEMKPARFLRPRTSVRRDMSMKSIDLLLTGYVAPVKRLRNLIGAAIRSAPLTWGPYPQR